MNIFIKALKLQSKLLNFFHAFREENELQKVCSMALDILFTLQWAALLLLTPDSSKASLRVMETFCKSSRALSVRTIATSFYDLFSDFSAFCFVMILRPKR